MNYFQEDIPEIFAYFHINLDDQNRITKKFMMILESVKGNVPAVMDDLLRNKELSAIEKLILIYALGSSIETHKQHEEIKRALSEGIKKGIEIGTQLPPGSSGKVEIISDKRGIGVKIIQDNEKSDSIGIVEGKQEIGDPMYR